LRVRSALLRADAREDLFRLLETERGMGLDAVLDDARWQDDRPLAPRSRIARPDADPWVAVDQGLQVRPDVREHRGRAREVGPAAGECRGDQSAQPPVVGRVGVQHVPEQARSHARRMIAYHLTFTFLTVTVVGLCITIAAMWH